MPVACIIDTNVILDLLSPHDYAVEFDACYPRSQATPKALKKLEFRKSRARYAHFLIEYLDQMSLGFLSLKNEPYRKLLDCSEGNPLYRRTQELQGHLVGLRLKKLKIVLTDEKGVTSTLADDYLLQQAVSRDLPLLTNELGTRSSSLLTKASKLGVVALSPMEFIKSKGINEREYTSSIIRAFANNLSIFQGNVATVDYQTPRDQVSRVLVNYLSTYLGQIFQLTTEDRSLLLPYLPGGLSV
jgi:hypothetical protein